MGEITEPLAVLPLLAVTSRYPAALDWSRSRFESYFGPLQLTSPGFVFDQTEYYGATMGTDLYKWFLAPAGLGDPGDLCHWKHTTNAWEDDFNAAHEGAESRPLNLDPGSLAQDKLVLASTKNHAHRIYLAHGIYAEVTLHYQGGRWQSHDWTYPDFQRDDYHAFFTQCRDFFRRRATERDSP